MEKLIIEYMFAAKRILRYVKGTLDHGLVNEKGEAGMKLVRYSNRNYAKI